MLGWTKKSKIKREIIVNAESLETRVAVQENGRLEEFQIEHAAEQRIVGSIFKGKIQNLEHDLQAAFVDIGLKKNAFLHYWDMLPDDDARLEAEEGRSGGEDSGDSINGDNSERDNRGGRGGRSGGSRGSSKRRNRRPSRRKRISNEEVEKLFKPGSEIVVQVTKGPIGTKGPRVTASLSIPGRYLVMMPGSKLQGVSRKISDGEERQRLKKVLDRLKWPAGAGLIVRTAGSGARKRSFVRDLRGLISTWEALQRGIQEDRAPCCVYQEPDLVERVVRDWVTEEVDRIIVDNQEKFEQIRDVAGTISRRSRSRVQLYEGHLPVFDHYGVESQIEAAFRRKVVLKCGGYIIFDETEALIAVDVNTGRHKGRGSQEEAILAVNTEAVEEVARQLRLRNIGGLVVIDLIDMRMRKHQNAVFRAMKNALKSDRARTNVLSISELGLMEMTRQRVEESLLSSMYVDCPYCRGRGSVKSGLSMSVDIQRQLAAVIRKDRKDHQSHDLQVVVHPTVLERLRSEDEEFLIDLNSRFEGKLSFRSDPGKHVEYFAIRDAVSGNMLYSTGEK